MKSPVTLRRSFANVLHRAELSLGDEVSRLDFQLDVGDAVVNELRWFKRLSPEKYDELIASLGNDGLWRDINYESSDTSNWEAAGHLRRLVALARQPRTDATVAACHKGLSGWLEAEHVNPNWWWREVGCPKELGVFALLFDDQLTTEERSAVVKCLSGVQLARTGQNRVWLAECLLLRGLVEGNDEVIAIAKDALKEEIAERDGVDGVQSDWSFHQHGKMPQFGNYGVAYLLTLARWAAVFADAGDGFAEEKLQVLGAFLEKGLEKFVWQGRMDVGALGRQFGTGVMRIKGLSVELATHYLGCAGWKSARELDRTGLSVYRQSAMAVYRTKRWMATIKAETRSILGVEQINGDNLLGAHLADGALFSYVKGDEYEDVFPVWNWRHVPGITTYDSLDISWTDASGKIKPRNQADVFEHTEDGRVRFVLQRDGLSAETEWTFSKDGIDVWVSRISAEAEIPVITVVEQARAKSNARWWREGDHIVAINGGVRYEVPGNAVVRIEPRLGRWQRVMGSQSARPTSVRIFEIVIPHGGRPNGAACGWKVRFPDGDEGLPRPLVSVVVPVYNVERYVGECLDSLLAQTYGNIEVICVNDGSTDGSGEILGRYEKQFDAARKYTIITQSNAGLSAARNAGMDAATGKYIYFLDSDDMVAPEAIENLVNLAELNELDQIIFNCRTFAEGNDPVLIADAESKSRNYYVVPPEVNYRMLDGKELFCELINRGRFYATQQMRFYKRDVLVANGLRYPEGLVHEDNYMAPLSLFFSEHAMIADEKWFLRRVRPNSIMTSGDFTARLRGMFGVLMLLCGEKRIHGVSTEYDIAVRKFLYGIMRGIGYLAKCTDACDWSTALGAYPAGMPVCNDGFVKVALLPFLIEVRNQESKMLNGRNRLFEPLRSCGDLEAENTEVAKRDELIAALQVQLEKSRKAVVDRDGWLVAEKARVAKRDERITALLAAHARLEKRIADRDGWLAAEKAKVAKRDERIVALLSVRAQLEKRMAACDERLAAEKSKVACIKSIMNNFDK